MKNVIGMLDLNVMFKGSGSFTTKTSMGIVFFDKIVHSES